VPLGSIHVKSAVTTGQHTPARGLRTETIYQSILEAVVEQRLPPGAKLTEEQLGAIFGASRTTVRSALQALAHDHIVTLAPNRGAFVSAPTVEAARDIFAGRKLVEVAIAREVARRISDSQLLALRALLADEQAAMERGDRGAAIRLSGAFHVSIAATCGEGVLPAFLRSLISQSSLAIALYGRRQTPACRHNEHIALLDALEKRDADRAAQIMSDHLDHILGDMDLAPPSNATVDLAVVLRAPKPSPVASGRNA
jgi:DNA-binding GntR family transcriptional regulator